MKRKLVFLFSLFFSIVAFSQTCPVINFTYDAAGNRIQRVPGAISCFPPPPPALKKQNTNSLTRDSIITSAIKINVFPNPAQDKINVEITQGASNEAKTIVLYDLTGKTIYTETTTLLNKQIDVSGLSLGMYYITVIQGKDKATYSVLKK